MQKVVRAVARGRMYRTVCQPLVSLVKDYHDAPLLKGQGFNLKAYTVPLHRAVLKVVHYHKTQVARQFVEQPHLG
jgi:hypothetical protein